MAVKKVDKQPESRVTFAGIPVHKRDTQIVVQDNLLYEDQYSGLYWSQANPTNLLIEPPFNPLVLKGLVTKNNVLAQCVSAMEVNIDGTGWDIEPRDDTSNQEPDKEYERLKAFFSEPFPDVGFISLRRKLRYDLEATGNAYMEVLRNLKGEIVFLRYMDSSMMRLVKLDEPVEVEKEIVRGGEKVKAKMMTRERRYAMRVAERMIYFREFGSSRNLHRLNCVWEGQAVEEGGKPITIEPEFMATEVIHFTLEPDAGSAYGIPRWINQLPSVLGSRKAEEFNLEFFDSGGVPPVAVFVQGGALAADVMEQLKAYFNGDAKTKHRAAIVEVQSTSGTLAAGGSVQVKTERFGESKSDAMFQAYDKNTEEHIRVGFRLPPMFIGRAQDYNFATAMTGYMVTEAQVFAPERVEFDEIINNKIVRGLGVENWVMRSKALTIKNVEVQLKAMEVVADKIDPEDMVGTINDIAGLDLKFSKEAYEKAQQAAQPPMMQGAIPDPSQGQQSQPRPRQRPGRERDNVTPIREAQNRSGRTVGRETQADRDRAQRETVRRVQKSEDLSANDIVLLAGEWAVVMGLSEGPLPDDSELVIKLAEELDDAQRQLFNNVLAQKAFVNSAVDHEGLKDILDECIHCGHEH